MSQTITPELVSIDVGLGTDKAAVIRALAQRVVAQGRATDAEALFADAWAREQKDETGLPGGIAIPHAKSAAVTVPSLAFARLQPGVDFGAPDGPADLVFLIAAPGQYVENVAFFWKIGLLLLAGLDLLYLTVFDGPWEVSAGREAPLLDKALAASALAAWIEEAPSRGLQLVAVSAVLRWSDARATLAAAR